ncbi:MAG TPA: hypothetical protein VEF35_10535 [Candidatus Bathyarchaeia archaeon]|nr:hypothetical protein [Candidatus Bathyarchaeia archaeon]
MAPPVTCATDLHDQDRHAQLKSLSQISSHKLPREFNDLTVKIATVYKTEHGGELAFVITTGESVCTICANLG